MKIRLHDDNGFTLIEVLISLLLAGILSVAAFSFYISEHNNMLSQMNISDMQQNVRATIADIASQTINAGANLPDNLAAVEATATNPDTLVIRHSRIGGSADVGDATLLAAAIPIRVPLGTDLSEFKVGQNAFLWHNATQQGEWFVISNLVTNVGAGWEEIHHMGGDFASNPVPGDKVMLLEEFKYYVNTADTAHPQLMREKNGGVAQLFASNISYFDVSFYLTKLDTVETLLANDTARIIRVAVAAQTEDVDAERERRSLDGRRYDTLVTEIMIRNSGS